MKQFLPAVLAVTLAGSVAAETVKDRAGAVRADRAEFESSARWNYNDVQRGFNEARRTGKPLLVVLRCVPCLGCAGIDASVLSDKELAPLLDQFVCVRVMNANALDLSLMQFDYDLSFSALFFNADRTVYGRFGSWTHQKNPLEKDTAAFKLALEKALDLHRGYPGNKAQLAAKQGLPLPFKDPLQIPALAGKYTRQLDWDNKVVQSCVHCHQIGDALRASHRAKGEPIPPYLVYPMPPPETIGLTLAADQVARVTGVKPGSTAAAAGLRVGDDIAAVDGQPLISATDLSWALHRAPEAGKMIFAIRRGTERMDVPLTLPKDWRSNSDIGRRVGTWQMRGMGLGGMMLEDLTDADRAGRGLAAGSMALLVKHVGEYGEHGAAKKAGFKKGDVIVGADTLTARMSEGALIGRLLGEHRRGERAVLTVLRGAGRQQLTLPMQ